MARSGRRLTIGAPGPLSRDELLSGDSGAPGLTRGEVSPHKPPPTERIPDAPPAAPAAEAEPVIVVPDDSSRPSGGPSDTGPGIGTGAPTADAPTAPDTGTAPDAGVEARGGKITGSEKEHPITAQAGEWVIQESAVKKYGDAFMKKLNAGQIKMVKQSAYAKGGKVSAPSGRAKRYA